MEVVIKTIFLGLIGAAIIALTVFIAKIAIDILIVIMGAIYWLLKMAAAIVALAGVAVVFTSAIDKMANNSEEFEGV